MSHTYYYSTSNYKYMLDQLFRPELVDCKVKSEKNNLISTFKNFHRHGNKEGAVVHKVFDDGERYTRIEDNLVGQHVTIIGGTTSDSELMELYELASAVVKYGAKTLTMIIPYFGYSTMERAVKSGEVVGAKVRARLLSSLPQAPGGNKVYMLDLHSEGIPYYFEGNTTPFHVYSARVVLDMIKNSVPQGLDYVLGSTDAGRAKWVGSLSRELGVISAFVYKNRLSGSETEVTGINAKVSDKHVVIYDDMIRSGSSLLGAARAYLEAGAVSVSAVATHGLFTKGPKNDLWQKDNQIFTSISTTDSHYQAQENPEVRKRVTVYPCLTSFIRVLTDNKE